MPRANTTISQNTFLEALRSEIVAGNENLSEWVKYIHTRGNIDLLFKLEAWLKGLNSFLSIDHLPLEDSEREALLDRNFLSEINIVRYTIQICENYACEILRSGEIEVFELEKLIENQIRKDRILDSHIGRFLEQMTPVDSISKLLDSLNDLRISIDAYLRLPNPDYQLFLAVGRNYRQELKSCRYIDMLLSQRFRIQYDLIENKSLTEVLRGIMDDQVRRDTALALLYLFRLQKYLDLVREDLDSDRSLRHHLVIFSLIHEEMENLSGFLKARFLKGRDPGQKLKHAADIAAYSMKTESRRVVSKELVALSRETDPTIIFAKIENSHGVLRNCCQSNILNMVSAIQKDFREESLFPERVERIAETDTIRRSLWDLRKWLMKLLENETAPDNQIVIDRLTLFKDTHFPSLMYRDWAEFEDFIEILAVSNSSDEILAYLRKFIDFIEDLIQEISKRGIHQVEIKI
ncbi:MAG: hypothetical protein P8Z37_04590 [Acidobacteriota bacterium]